MKKLNSILLVLGATFFVYLVWKIGMSDLLRELRAIGWGLLAFILAEGAAEMIHTVAWRHCLSGPFRSLPWWLLFRIRLAGYAINNLTPSASLGGEVTRAALLAAKHRGPDAVSGVLIEKVCFALAHVLFVALGAAVVLGHIHLPRPLMISMLFSGTLVAGGTVTFLLLQRHGKLGGLIRWVAARRMGGRALEMSAANITAVDEALRAFYRERPADMWLAVCWHLVGFSTGIAQTWLFFYLLNQEASLLVAAAVWSLGMWFDLLTFAVPLNAGTLEGSRIVAFKAIGYSSLLGMTYGLALRLAQLFWAGFGLVSYGFLVTRKSDSPVQNAERQLSGEGGAFLDTTKR